MVKLSAGERKYLLGVILTLSENGWTRLKKVADFFGVRMPTAKEFLDSLTKKGLLDYERRGSIFLTKRGQQMAEKEKNKYDVLVTFMTRCLLVGEETAKKNAIKIMFDLDEEVAERMYEFIDFMTKCPSRPVFIEKFEQFVKDGTYQPCAFCPIVKREGVKENDC